MMKESEDQHVNDVTGAWPADLHREWDTDIQVTPQQTLYSNIRV